MIKILYAHCLGPSPAISAQFTLKMCVTARNLEKSLKQLTIDFFVRSLKFIDVDILMKLVTSACYNKQHVCAHV